MAPEGMRILLLPLMAFFVAPKLMQYIPNFDPLMAIVGLFLLLAAAQHLGLVGSVDANGEAPSAGRSRGSNRNRRSEEEDSAPTLEGQLAEAERCIKQNAYDRAQILAQKAADLDPESARAWELLATAQKWSGQREEALATVKKAKDIYEVDSPALSALLQELGESKSPADIATECETKGEEFMSKRMYDLAVGCYTQAVEALEATEVLRADRSLHLRLLRRRAECAQQLQDWSLCRRDATALLEEDPNDPRALLQRAAANESLEKFKAALEDARKLLSIDPKSAVANRIVHNCQKALRD